MDFLIISIGSFNTRQMSHFLYPQATTPLAEVLAAELRSCSAGRRNDLMKQWAYTGSQPLTPDEQNVCVNTIAEEILRKNLNTCINEVKTCSEKLATNYMLAADLEYALIKITQTQKIYDYASKY